jgi:hypothetical protein
MDNLQASNNPPSTSSRSFRGIEDFVQALEMPDGPSAVQEIWIQHSDDSHFWQLFLDLPPFWD